MRRRYGQSLKPILATPAATDEIVIDVPEPNGPAVEMVRRLGFVPSFETARMYRGPAPAIPTDKVFGITTLELG